ncbi:MAG: diaminopimelate decarboxylase [Gammaproteobacteria bacterium]|nr:diaminopimelate decarboxylase [Gammaproteobacteria bacterium]
MDFFNFREGHLFAEDLSLVDIAARYGTPCYVYSRATLERHWRAFDEALSSRPHLICYAVKANSSLAVLNVLARLGSGFDIVSGGELQRVLKAGGDAGKIVFSGVGKQVWEIRLALDVGIRCFNVESEAELDRIEQIAAELGKPAPISFRVNPDVDAGSHPYISTGLRDNKFGIDINVVLALYERAAASAHLDVVGVDCHIGSQVVVLAPFIDAVGRVMKLVETLQDRGIALKHLDFGGGLGVRYDNESPPSPLELASALAEALGDHPHEIILEPGRAIAANAGILLTRVEYLKEHSGKHFAIVDAAMNDLIRPSLYGAFQDITPVELNGGGALEFYDIVGPICETGDFLGKRRELPLSAGTLLAVRSAGAYGSAMSSNYNDRPKAAEVMIDGDRSYLIRARQSIEDLWRGEEVLPD